MTNNTLTRSQLDRKWSNWCLLSVNPSSGAGTQAWNEISTTKFVVGVFASKPDCRVVGCRIVRNQINFLEAPMISREIFQKFVFSQISMARNHAKSSVSLECWERAQKKTLLERGALFRNPSFQGLTSLRRMEHAGNKLTCPWIRIFCANVPHDKDNLFFYFLFTYAFSEGCTHSKNRNELRLRRSELLGLAAIETENVLKVRASSGTQSCLFRAWCLILGLCLLKSSVVMSHHPHVSLRL